MLASGMEGGLDETYERLDSRARAPGRVGRPRRPAPARARVCGVALAGTSRSPVSGCGRATVIAAPVGGSGDPNA